ncbi:FAD binding domain-containing protein [Paenibacillus agricola]|uniref:Xanthine dehydrogenase n=1 Tax=Paenibacillus agricola TaxID=2716264 RepID=A0ABX0JAL7_9BACL|nr:FAD binding domain-containing protein [Paenibacillus agricola]NHN32796.1 xanthine dehydrogenase [Paenibacillus agricola]
MISFDFEYYKPTTVEEAVRLFQQQDSEGKEPLYYSGGTEIISMARLNQLRTRAVIDIKGIPECNVMQIRHEQLVIGAAITLTALSEANLFPLLGETVRNVADYTNRNKITVGGNLCGKFIYREALLPFLLADSHVVLAGTKGIRHVPIHQILNGEPRLEKGELLVQILSDRRYLNFPFVTVKKTKQEKIDYPIVRISGLRSKEGMRVAFSGVSAVPFRSWKIEEVLNNPSLPLEERVENAIRIWPVPILNDILSSAAYRTFVLRNTLTDAIDIAALERRIV